MRTLLSIFIYTNCWVALCVTSLVFGLVNHYNLDHKILYSIWSFTGTVSAYQLHRIIRLRQLKHSVRSNRRLLWMQNSYTFQIIWLTINFILFSIASLQLTPTISTISLIAINAVVVALYALPLPSIGNGIRTLPFIKNLLISLSWACIVLIPFTSENSVIPFQVPLFIFIAVFAQIIPFDIRDLDYDDKRMRTVPQLFGKTVARYIGALLILTSICIEYNCIGFHWIVILLIPTALISQFISFRVGTQLIVEFMWELPLGIMGLWLALS